MSEVVRVLINSEHPPESGFRQGDELVLELYDHRGGGVVSSYLEDDASDDEELGVGANEAFLHKICQTFFQTETAIYDRLQEFQGTKLPRYFGAVLVSPLDNRSMRETSPCSCSVVNVQSFDTDCCQVHGILLEYVVGVQMDHTIDDFPKEVLYNLVIGAASFVNCLGDYGVLSSDARPSNFLIRECSKGPEAVMIDFAMGRLRSADETDKEWRLAKWRADEEGRIKGMMKRYVDDGYDLGHSFFYYPEDYD